MAAACGGAGRPAAAVTWTGAQALTGTEDGPTGVATDGTRVFFTTGRTQVGENALRSVALDGDPVSHVVATSPGGRGPNGRVAVDGDTVYLAAGSGIVRVSAAGGAATAVVDGRPAGVQDVVVAGDQLWWTTYQYLAPDRVEIAHMAKAGGPVEVAAVNVSTGLDDPHPEGGAALVGGPRGVLRVRAGAPPEVVVAPGPAGGPVTHLAVDDQRLYVLVAGGERLLALPRAGGAPVALATGIDSSKGLAVVGDQVVFFRTVGTVGSGGRATLQAVPGGGGPERTIASGSYADGDLAAVGADRVVFSADDRVWVASVRA
jgi:hypothetical protein